MLLLGFNALFATASIETAKRCYAEFARQQAGIPAVQQLKIGLIYSFVANEADGLERIEPAAHNRPAWLHP